MWRRWTPRREMELLEAIEGYWKIIPSPKKTEEAKVSGGCWFLRRQGSFNLFHFLPERILICSNPLMVGPILPETYQLIWGTLPTYIASKGLAKRGKPSQGPS